MDAPVKLYSGRGEFMCFLLNRLAEATIKFGNAQRREGVMRLRDKKVDISIVEDSLTQAHDLSICSKSKGTEVELLVLVKWLSRPPRKAAKHDQLRHCDARDGRVHSVQCIRV